MTINILLIFIVQMSNYIKCIISCHERYVCYLSHIHCLLLFTVFKNLNKPLLFLFFFSVFDSFLSSSFVFSISTMLSVCTHLKGSKGLKKNTRVSSKLTNLETIFINVVNSSTYNNFNNQKYYFNFLKQFNFPLNYSKSK